MQIKALPNSTKWVVIGELFGQKAVVFTGTIFGCLRFRDANA